MSIKRAPRPQGNFYILDKSISEDKRLTWGARGLLVYLLGKPDHWQVSTAAIVNETAGTRTQSGRDAVRALLGELIDAGYVSRTVARGDDGKVAGYDYSVSEVCASPAPGTDYPAPVKPATAQPAPADPRQVSTESLSKTDGEQSISDQAFAQAWAAYPKRAGGNNRAEALKAWKARITQGVEHGAMVAGVERYAAFCKATGKLGTEYVKQAATFFGPALHFAEDWTAPRPANDNRPHGRHTGLTSFEDDGQGGNVSVGGL